MDFIPRDFVDMSPSLTSVAETSGAFDQMAAKSFE